MHPFKCVRRVYKSHQIVIFAYITVGLESNAIHVSLNHRVLRSVVASI